MFFQDFGMIPSTAMVAIWDNSKMVIIKCLFDLEIIYEMKNSWSEIKQSLLNDNFTMQESCYIVKCVYNHIEIQGKTLLNM